MNLGHQYLENIHSLVTDLIPLKVCQYYCFLPISVDKRTPPRVLVAMVEPNNVIACDVLKKHIHHKNYRYKKSYIKTEDYQRLISLYSEYLQNLEQENKLKLCLRNLQYNFNTYKSNKPLTENKAKFNDLVLGGQQKKYNNYVVLGGVEGIKHRLNNNSLPVQIQALHDCLKYPQNCQKILLEVIKKKHGLMVWVAYSLLSNLNNPEITARLAQFKQKVNRESLEEVNLAKVNLKNINLVNSNLIYANFRQVIINENTQLDPQLLLQWGIVNQGLVGGNLSNFNFHKANLSYARLVKLNCRQTRFFQVKLCHSNLEQIDLIGSEFTDVNFQDSRLIYLKMKNTLLNQVDLANCHLNRISLIKSKLTKINLINSNLNHVDFSNSVLEEVDFYRAKLINIDFKNVIFKQVNFKEATLHNVDMSYLNLSQTKINFNHLDLSGCKFIRTNFQGLNLSNANLRQANLSGANLANANLADTNLSETKLTLATFNRHTIFPSNFSPERAGAIYGG